MERYFNPYLISLKDKITLNIFQRSKGKTKEFEVSYNDAEKMTNNDYDRRIEHGFEIVFSNNQYTTPVSFEFLQKKIHNI